MNNFKDVRQLALKYFGFQLPIKPEELKKAYHQACKKLHPDKGGNEEEFKTMQQAYERLIELGKTVPGIFYGHASQDDLEMLGLESILLDEFEPSPPFEFAIVLSLARLTRAGFLEWHNKDGVIGFRVYKAYPSQDKIKTEHDLEILIGKRLSGAVIGYPENGQPLRLMVRDGAGRPYFFDASSNDQKMETAIQLLYEGVEKAFFSFHSKQLGDCKRCGEQWAEIIFCQECKQETKHKHVADFAYGIPGAYLSGTERYECLECGNCIFYSDKVNNELYKDLAFRYQS